MLAAEVLVKERKVSLWKEAKDIDRIQGKDLTRLIISS